MVNANIFTYIHSTIQVMIIPIDALDIIALRLVLGMLLQLVQASLAYSDFGLNFETWNGTFVL